MTCSKFIGSRQLMESTCFNLSRRVTWGAFTVSWLVSAKFSKASVLVTAGESILGPVALICDLK